MIKYREIEFLPEDHPIRIRFFQELIAEEEHAAEVISPNDDEESLAYFDRFIAGDR